MSVRPVIHYQDLGLAEYRQAWDHQERLFRSVTEQKLKNSELPVSSQKAPSNYLIFCEHPHVFTMGKSGNPQNLLLDEKQLKSKGVAFYRINRGGDITYHGPGQIVGYPILDLAQFDLGIRNYIDLLEESVVRTLLDFGMHAGRLASASGVWLEPNSPGRARKICAIGVRASRGVTMHGFAFNVNTDLSFYKMINPCGFTDKGVTSMQTELGVAVDIDMVKKKLKEKIMELLYNT